ncbi:MAG TPA: hypothetical protein PLO08_10605, partial [Alicycliphilus sp.]|nr:hypothetical protein [Alicycliphilus sp.]
METIDVIQVGDSAQVLTAEDLLAKFQETIADAPAPAPEEGDPNQMPLATFIEEFGEGLLGQVRSQNPAVYDPAIDETSVTWRQRQAVLDGLKRKP